MSDAPGELMTRDEVIELLVDQNDNEKSTACSQQERDSCDSVLIELLTWIADAPREFRMTDPPTIAEPERRSYLLDRLADLGVVAAP